MAKASVVEGIDKAKEQIPQGGGSYVRNEDGSLSVNQSDMQKITPAHEDAVTENPKE